MSGGIVEGLKIAGMVVVVLVAFGLAELVRQFFVEFDRLLEEAFGPWGQEEDSDE